MSPIKREIILLTDYRGSFWSTVRNGLSFCSLDVDLLKKAFEEQGFQLKVVPFSKVNFRTHNFRDQIVLYQSSEDRGTSYKDYLEDVLLGIQMQGGRLIPSFHCFRAHHNKVFMELLRDLSCDARMLRPRAWTFGTLEDFKTWSGTYPAVLKQAWGAGSRGVRIGRDHNEAVTIAARFSRSPGILQIAKEYFRRFWRRRIGYVPYSIHRKKIIIQEFLPDLSGDFKVLVYWDRYYVVSRKNREGDFRASGSGLLTWPELPPAGLLDFALHVFTHFHVPMISLDIAMTNDGPVLIEFQFVSFGTATLERSDWFFQQQQGNWTRVQAKSMPETEFARSIACYLS